MKKIERIQRLVVEGKRFDLMFEEFELIELYSRFRQSVAKWGDTVFLFWNTVQKN